MDLIFLGTGPFGGIKAQGKSSRFESSILLKAGNSHILIDVTSYFKKQATLTKSVDDILITHAHKDAIGGINQLIQWIGKRNIKKIRCKDWSYLPLFHKFMFLYKCSS